MGNVLFLSNKKLVKIKNVIGLLEGFDNVTSYDAQGVSHASMQIENFDSAVLVVFLTDFNFLNDVVSFINDLYKTRSESSLKIITINYIKHANLRSVLKMLGVENILKSTVSPEIIVKSILKSLEKVAYKGDDALEEAFRNPGNAIQSSSVNLSGKMTTKTDYFIHRGKTSFIKMGNEWEFSLFGPGKSLGDWIKTDEVGYSQKNIWEYRPDDFEHELFKGQSGKWFFQGRRPHFSNGLWHFSAKNPTLFYKNNVFIETKISSQDNGKTIQIMNNSSACEELLKVIKGTYNPEHISEVSRDEIFKEIQNELPFASIVKQDAFREITNKKEFKLILDETVKDKCLLTLWTPKQEVVVPANLKDSQEHYFVVCNKKNDYEDIYKTTNQLDSKCLFTKIDLPRGMIFFPIEEPSLNYGDNRIEVDIPEKAWRVQRREHFRLDVTKDLGIFCRVLHNEDRMIPELINISAGGAAFQINYSLSQLNPDDILNEIFLRIDGVDLRTSAEIKWIQEPIENKKSLIIGVSFRDLEEKELEFINRYAIEKSVEYLKKYLDVA